MESAENQFRVSRRPADINEDYRWRIRRVKAGERLKLMILSTDIFGVEMHYWGGNSMPCMLKNCPACKAGNESRWYGYVLAVETSKRKHVIWEMTPPAVPPLDDAFKQYKTMRGLLVIAWRFNDKDKGRIETEVKGITVPDDTCSEAFTVWDPLARIWRLKKHMIVHVAAKNFDELSEYQKAG